MRILSPNKIPINDTSNNSYHKIKVVLIVLLIAVIGISKIVSSHAASATSSAIPEIIAANSDVCLNQSKGQTVDAISCSGSANQNWVVDLDNIKHNNQCLSVSDDSKSDGALVDLASCQNLAGQVWLRDKSGYFNPNSGLCLNDPGSKTNVSLVITSCSMLSNAEESWSSIGNPSSKTSANDCSNYTKGEKIACYAELEWTSWQSTSSSHQNLLSNYTDGNSYEEWCADFVSYVYKEAGYPFTQGERDNWDQYDANQIEDMGFTLHYPSGYNPKPGDVAYFNYFGGHVEIVVSGGETPTFVYGDSATIDPVTGNGDMEANTKTSEAGEGQLMYYLSPN